MNRKGFTLIELIATIALLGVIAVIAFVGISRVITKNKIENCKTLVKNITVAASEYAGDNRYKSSFINRIVSNELIITADELISNNYLNGDIIDPYDNSLIDPNTISVHMYFNGDYTVNYVVIDNPDKLNKCNEEPKEGVVVPTTEPYVSDGSDKTPPVITYNLTGGIYKGKQTLTINATDNESGIDYMMVEVYIGNDLITDKSNDKIMTNTYQIDLDKYATYKVLTKAYDKAGNVSSQEPMTEDGRYYQEYEIIGKPIHVYYHQNGGTISGICSVGEEKDKKCSAYNGWAANGTTYAYKICKVDTECNLWNYNNPNYMNITRSGYGTKANKEWKADGNGTIFSQNKDYTYETLKAAIYRDKGDYYELNLRVNWLPEAVITCNDVTYNGSAQTIAVCDGGTISNASQTNAGSYTITCAGDSAHVNASAKTCTIEDAVSSIPSSESGCSDCSVSHTFTCGSTTITKTYCGTSSYTQCDHGYKDKVCMATQKTFTCNGQTFTVTPKKVIEANISCGGGNLDKDTGTNKGSKNNSDSGVNKDSGTSKGSKKNSSSGSGSGSGSKAANERQ